MVLYPQYKGTLFLLKVDRTNDLYIEIAEISGLNSYISLKYSLNIKVLEMYSNISLN
jgi:hypothetical protein